jgi:hypothetical protein
MVNGANAHLEVVMLRRFPVIVAPLFVIVGCASSVEAPTGEDPAPPVPPVEQVVPPAKTAAPVGTVEERMMKLRCFRCVQDYGGGCTRLEQYPCD